MISKEPKLTVLQSFSNDAAAKVITLGRVVRNYRRAHFFEGQKRFNHFLNIAKLYLSQNWKGSLPSSDESQRIEVREGYFLHKSNRIPSLNLAVETKELTIERNTQTKRIIVSDFDDTIIKSRATSLTRLILTTLFKPIGKREVFPEVSSFYKRLQGQNNLFFYISSSTWNIYPLLRGFLEHSDLPQGILLLKEMKLGSKPQETTLKHSHKLEKIQSLIDFYDDLPFILIGDAGQEDRQIYQRIAELNPGRIEVILIRHKWWERIMEKENETSKASGTKLIYFNNLNDIQDLPLD
ncbi:MAG: App1 family protein [Bdellovibrionota bacterium]|nr:App1 family protein [Bdellovibrionota bacterium]